MKKILAMVAVVVLVVCVNAFAQTLSKGPWMHLEVLEKNDDPGTVKVNLPVSMVDVALNMVKDQKIKEGRLKLDHQDFSVAEMRQLWDELKKAGNAEFVTVEKKDETVRISRQGDFVLVKVSHTGNAEKVDIKMPVGVVDALLSGPGEELNLKAAIAAMKEKNIGDILTVNETHTQVRLWID